MVFRSAKRRWLLSCFSLLFGCSALFGCSDDEALTELVVVVDTNFTAPTELDSITLNVEGPSGMQYPVTTTLGAEGSPTLPLFTFLEPAGEALGPLIITATARLGETDLVEQQVRTSFIRGESRTVYMSLVWDCRDVTCEAEMTCNDGACRSVDVPPTSLPVWTGSLEEPDGSVDGGLDGGTDGSMDAGDASTDSGTDSGPADSCVPSVEVCNGVDDNCDGVADEGFDLMTDSANCGACGMVCNDQARASVACVSGSCTLTCDTDFDDCDSDFNTGCEADLSAPANCGACSSACGASAPLCDPAMGCVSGCSGGTDLCSMACVATGTDINNCGSCGMVCPDPSRSAPSCAAGACGFSCDVGFGDCDTSATNGCEERLNTLAHCAACGRACTVMNGTGDCATGTCDVGTCNTGFADCDGAPGNGCEAPELAVYRDADSDGYGDPTVAATAPCAPMAGWVTNSRDCDDRLASKNPDAPEICNQLDDDCDGSPDNGLVGCGESCRTPMVVEGSMEFTNMVTCGADDSGDAPCGRENADPDHVYQLVITTPMEIRFDITGDGHPTTWMESTCNTGEVPFSCLTHDWNQREWLEPGTYYLHIEYDHDPCSDPYDIRFIYP